MSDALKILLVEDSADDAALVRRELKKGGLVVDCTVVDNERDFLAGLTAHVDVVISDYTLPNFNGLHALELLKQREMDIPFILLSGTIGEETAVTAIKQGATDYLLKDRLARLGAAVQQALDVRRMQRDKRLTESNLQLFRKLLEQIDDGIEIIDPDTARFLDANERAFRSLGYTREEFLHLKVFDIAPSITPAIYAANLERLRSEGPFIIEDTHRHRNGTLLPVEINFALIQHKREYLIATVRDITARKQAEEKLRFHEAILRDAGRIAKLGGWSLEVDSGAIYRSEEAARILGHDPNASVSPDNALGAFEGLARKRIEAAMTRAITAATPYDLELELTTTQGTHKWVRVIGHPVEEQGRVVRLRGAIQDISQLKEAELALRESETRFRQLAETIDEVFWITDPDKRALHYVSPAYEKIWGRTCDSLYANPQNWIEAIHSEDRVRIELATMERQARGDYDVTYRIIRPDGSVRWIHDRAFPVKSENGSVSRVVGVAEDITARKELEIHFHRSQRLEVIGTLAGGVAHDLNNILAPMLMAAELLQARVVNRQDRDLIAMVQQSAQRGANVIKQLLSFSRGTDGQRELVQVRHLLKEVVSIVRETFPREISLEEEVGSTLWPVKANATQVHQVLMNLCVNARDAMPKGGVLTLRAANHDLTATEAAGHPRVSPGPYLLLCISDTGQGIASEIIERIFDPFFTTKAEGQGTGLGLATALGIINAHDGFITVDSKVGAGSTFKVYLPATPAGTQATVEVEPAPASAGRGVQILVVDDEAQFRDAIRHVLQNQGYAVLTASHGQEAVSVFNQHSESVSVICTDVMMPVMNGPALIRALRVLKPNLKVIACTGLLESKHRQDLEELGVGEILMKPFQARDVLAAIERQLTAD